MLLQVITYARLPVNDHLKYILTLSIQRVAYGSEGNSHFVLQFTGECRALQVNLMRLFISGVGAEFVQESELELLEKERLAGG